MKIIDLKISIVSTVILFLAWFLRAGDKFKFKYMGLVFIYFIFLLINSSLIIFVLKKFRIKKLLLGAVIGIITGFFGSIIMSIILIFLSVISCSGVDCGQIGIIFPALILISFIIIMIPTIIMGVTNAKQ